MNLLVTTCPVFGDHLTQPLYYSNHLQVPLILSQLRIPINILLIFLRQALIKEE